MFRIGVFIDSASSVCLEHLIELNSTFALKGVFGREGVELPMLPCVEVFDSADGLLAQIDVALILGDGDGVVPLAVQAIKSGVNVYVDSFHVLTLADLTQMDMLAREIDIKLGFGHLGYRASIDGVQVEYPMIAEVRRNVSIASTQHLDLILKRDLATAININRSTVHRVHAYGVPSKVAIPSVLFVVVDFDNSSAITYILNNTSGDNSFEIKIHHSTEPFTYNVPNPDILDCPLADFNNFIAGLEGGSEQYYGFELAICAASVVATIYSKL